MAKVTTPALEFRDVSISFDDVPALQHISFVLHTGAMICITGDSCSGKSVLLRVALGLLRPDQGEVIINGRDITRMAEAKLLSLRRDTMGMVFQENAVFTGQTVYENTAYRLEDHDWPEDKIDTAVSEVLTFVGLQDDREKQAEELSGGMKRRLELARALIGWPSIMLFDEPTSGLDPINARQVLDLIIRARDLYHTSSLYVTKALHEIPYLADYSVREVYGHSAVVRAPVRSSAVQVCLLEKGQIAFFGSVEQFERSSLPAVQHMFNPVTGAIHGHREIKDPWKHPNRTSSST